MNQAEPDLLRHTAQPAAARPRTIALLTDAWFPQVNGVVTTYSNVRQELEAQGHEVLVIHPGLFATVPAPRYPQIRLAIHPDRRVRELLDFYQPDQVHIATEGPIGLAARRHCTKRRWAFTTSYHTQFPHYLRVYFGIPIRWTYAAMKWYHGRAVRTLVPTESVKRELDERGWQNVCVWTRGVNTMLFRPQHQNGLATERPIFLYTGRVAPEKNINAFLDAKLPGTKVVVGDGPSLGKLKHQYPAVQFVGAKFGEDLALQYAAADVFVFPSRTDTFGVVMLEAMACGVPVAAYPVTGPRDVIENGRTGVMHDDLATAAIRALDLNRQMCRAAAEQFSWRRCAEQFLAALAPR